jgi:NTP pyrophosphatase (non-canonical NTP hydrolase)
MTRTDDTERSAPEDLMDKPFNDLSPAEVERLAWLSEELGEAQQAIGKILRHGYESKNPQYLGPPNPTNRESLERELGDVMAAIEMSMNNRDVDRSGVLRRVQRKLGLVGQWMHHQ